MHTVHSFRILARAIVAIATCTAACSGAHNVAAPSAKEPLLSTTASASPSGYTTARTGDVHDFDFLAGAWTAQQRRLKARGVGSNEWDEFPSKLCATLYLDSVVNVDEMVFPTKGWSGVTLRSFNLEKRQWSIYWINSRTGTLFPPVVGGFEGDRGEFYGEDDDDGRPVKARFVWTKLGPDRARWEQAFSYDGRTWEVNWTADFVRADPASCAAGRPKP